MMMPMTIDPMIANGMSRCGFLLAGQLVGLLEAEVG